MNILNFAQTTSTQCTLNGQPIDCGELAAKAEPFIGLGLGIMAFAILLFIASFIFWLIMLIHAFQHDSPDRTLWIIILAAAFVTGFGLIGALVYFFAEKKKAEAATAAKRAQAPPPASPATTAPSQGATPMVSDPEQPPNTEIKSK